MLTTICYIYFTDRYMKDFINTLSANPTKWSNTLKQFVGCFRQIVWVCLTILWVWCLKGSEISISIEDCNCTSKISLSILQILKNVWYEILVLLNRFAYNWHSTENLTIALLGKLVSRSMTAVRNVSNICDVKHALSKNRALLVFHEWCK